MIAGCLLILFGVSCLWLIVDGLKRRAGVFEFSFLAGCGLFGYLFLQAVGIVRNSEMAPESGVVKALLMSTLCAVAVYRGWKAPVRTESVASSRFLFSPKWVYGWGIVCIVVGLVGFLKLAGLSGGIVQHYSTRGSYALEWRGLPVAYVFFEWYFYLASVLVALVALRLRSWLLLAPAVVPGLVALSNIVFLGRRTEFILLGVALGCVLYFGRGVVPPRALVMGLAPLAMATMFVAPAYRANSEIGGDSAQIRKISVPEAVREVVSGTTGEFWTMAYLMEIADTQGLFQGGVGFYNAFVAVFVPKLVVGEEFKAKLFVDLPTARSATNNYGWAIPYGMVPTGPYSVFEQFWYFGALCFYFLARWLKRYWIRAVAGDLWSQVAYSVMVTFAVGAVVNDIYAIYNPVFMFIVPLMVLTKLRMWFRGLAEPYCCVTPARYWPRAPRSAEDVPRAAR